MGIRRLTRTLLPFSQTVILDGTEEKDNVCQQGTKRINSVVIDGPSLVHHVFSRLQSRLSCNGFPGGQPTCSQVSLGVMLHLLHLLMVGVKVEKIIFDGALPPQKRHIRLSRLEKSRKRLEHLRSTIPNGFAMSIASSNNITINPENIMRTRALPVSYDHLLETPFIVPAVFEDLRFKWNRNNIMTAIEDLFSIPESFDIGDFPWANSSIIVPGEADAQCVNIARQTGSSILTNDSDLLLYDLSSNSLVVFLDTIELKEWDPGDPAKAHIEATGITPGLLARRLGVSSISCLAFQLKNNPNMKLPELIQKSKATDPENARFQMFTEEFLDISNSQLQDANQRLPQHFDTRTSELFCQFKYKHTRRVGEDPHVYLVILIEDHARRCAWQEGRLYRCLAYSVFNNACPEFERCHSIIEFVRRGGRVFHDKILLGNGTWIAAQIKVLLARLQLVQSQSGRHMTSSIYWRVFALYDIFNGKADLTRSGVVQLCQFLTLGYMGKKLEWTDVHLAAQVQSVLYSLRTLKQLLDSTVVSTENTAKLKVMLTHLPPLHVIMRSTSEVINESHTEDLDVDSICRLFSHGDGNPCSEVIGETRSQKHFRQQSRAKFTSKTKGQQNTFELLSVE